MIVVEERPTEDTDAIGSILTMNYNGSGLRTLYPAGSQPTWADDGTNIVFTQTASEGATTSTHLYSIAADGSNASNPVPLISESGSQSAPEISPDGNRLVFIHEDPTTHAEDIDVANFNGSDATPLGITGLKRIAAPTFAPNESEIVFAAREAAHPEGPRQLYAINLDGTDLHALTNSTTTDYSSPSYTPDGDTIVADGNTECTRDTDYIAPDSHRGTAPSSQPRRETVSEGADCGQQIWAMASDGSMAHIAISAQSPYQVSYWHGFPVDESCSSTAQVCGTWTWANTSKAYAYAFAFSQHPNPEYFYYRDDCADYVSQLLHAAGVHIAGNVHTWYTHTFPYRHGTPYDGTPEMGAIIGAPSHSASWVNVAALYEMLVKTHLATPVPSNAEDVEQAGDIIFFDWYNTAGVYNHVGMVVSGRGMDRENEIYTSHTKGRFTEMSRELATFLPESLGIADSEGTRDVHWNWHILRMVHTIAYVP